MPPAAAGQEAEQPRQRMSWINTILIFLAIQFFVGQLTSRATQKPAPSPETGAPGTNEKGEPVQLAVVPTEVYPYWSTGTKYDFRLYITDSSIFTNFDSEPVLEGYGLTYGDSKYRVTRDILFPTTEALRNNGSVSAHLYIAKSGTEFNPSLPDYDPKTAYDIHFRLSHYMPQKKEVKTKRLLGGGDKHTEQEVVEEPTGPAPILPYWHPNISIGMVPSDKLNYIQTPPPTRQWVTLESTGLRDSTGQNGWYYPIVFYDQFWQLSSQMMEINSTVSYLPMTIEFIPVSYWKFQLLVSMDAGFKQQAQSMGQSGSGELEEFKRVLMETNIWLLGITVLVSILHMLFEMLAFKNDISHWKNKKDNVGVSVRTIIANVVMQTIIFLYLLDNNENTSWMVMFTQGSGILVEAWKITKAVDVKIEPSTGVVPYQIVFKNKNTLSETEKKTQEYDEIAFKYMYIAAVPLIGAYAVYSLIYETHKSWYSFIITTLVGSVYAYGFLMLVPSIYINYRLKSVAHMPRRAMIYKFLNTFIDDLFAFVIKMPILHRLATLRDDVIFFIYLYQTWLYRVDPTRVNEFGQVGEDEDEAAQGKKESEDSKEDIPAADGSVTSSAKVVESSATRRK
ncbi:cleft lip and palate transmembrane protein 1-domain-containing protein [Lipomyces kononenkoae]|uniref:Cleft lip and palate transmembrane protein 1-domain-containing protein n=1 Tax=Lipomyces kononenkoae TaxID=34357 RepID=A0ACC3T2C9_LIPKO